MSEKLTFALGIAATARSVYDMNHHTMNHRRTNISGASTYSHHPNNKELLADTIARDISKFPNLKRMLDEILAEKNLLVAEKLQGPIKGYISSTKALNRSLENLKEKVAVLEELGITLDNALPVEYKSIHQGELNSIIEEDGKIDISRSFNGIRIEPKDIEDPEGSSYKRTLDRQKEETRRAPQDKESIEKRLQVLRNRRPLFGIGKDNIQSEISSLEYKLSCLDIDGTRLAQAQERYDLLNTLSQNPASRNAILEYLEVTAEVYKAAKDTIASSKCYQDADYHLFVHKVGFFYDADKYETALSRLVLSGKVNEEDLLEASKAYQKYTMQEFKKSQNDKTTLDRTLQSLSRFYNSRVVGNERKVVESASTREEKLKTAQKKQDWFDRDY